MDRNGPDVDKDKQNQIGELVHREQKDVNVVWDTLQKAIDWVESMASKWCGYLKIYRKYTLFDTEVCRVHRGQS